MRVDVRFYADLISSGVLTPKEGLPLLGSFLTNLIHGDKEEHNSATIILAFCKFCGEEYAGLVSQKLMQDAERFKLTVPTSTWLPPDKRQNVRNLLREYYASLCKHLTQVGPNHLYLLSKKHFLIITSSNARITRSCKTLKDKIDEFYRQKESLVLNGKKNKNCLIRASRNC